MAFKILLRAAPGEFSKVLASIFDEQPIDLVVCDTTHWSDGNEIERYLEGLQPSIVVNSPFLTETPETEALAHGILCAYCKTHAVPLIHFSSYRAFGNVSNGEALAEEAIPDPSDALGEHLSLLETSCAALERHIILRTSWVLGEANENLLAILVPKLLSGEQFVVSDHDYGNPVNNTFLANVVSAIAQQILCGAENWGAFHVHASDKCSEAELCDVLVRLVSAEMDNPVRMPEVAGQGNPLRLLHGNALLAGRRCTENFGIQLPSWRKGLKGLVKAYLTSHGHLSS